MVGMVKDENGYSVVHALKLVSLSGENKTIEAHYIGTLDIFETFRFVRNRKRRYQYLC